MLISVSRVWRILVLLTASISVNQTTQAEEAKSYTVLASPIPPCVYDQTNSPSGFSIQLWEEIALELNIDEQYELEVVDFNTKMQRVLDGSADIAIGCISMSADRERLYDFTHPVSEGGFQAISLLKTGWFPSFSESRRNLLLVLLAFVVIFAHVMWIAERGSDSITDKYIPGIFEAAWFSVVTMSTVGYGDIAPKGWWGKASALALILSGVAAFGVIVSQFTADAITDPAEVPITNERELQSYLVGTKRGTSSEDYLQSLAVNTMTFSELEDAVEALRAGEVDLLLYDSLATSNLANRNSDLVTTGPVLKSHHLAMALPPDSELRESINRALLKFHDNGLLETIRQRWF